MNRKFNCLRRRNNKTDFLFRQSKRGSQSRANSLIDLAISPLKIWQAQSLSYPIGIKSITVQRKIEDRCQFTNSEENRRGLKLDSSTSSSRSTPVDKTILAVREPILFN